MTKGLNAPATHLSTRYSGVTIPANAVDSVNIEIRNATTALGSTVRRFAPAWLMTDGTLRSFTNIALSGVAFDAPSGAYYVVVRHRNHLAVMSSATVSLTTSPASYNFTLAAGAAYGTGAMKALAGARYGMFAADANGSGDVSILDRGAWRTQNSQTGYLGADFNLSGDVSILDRGLWLDGPAPRGWLSFAQPNLAHTDLLDALSSLARARWQAEPPILAALERVLVGQDGNGCWAPRQAAPFGEPAGQPSRWLTLRALVAVAAYGDSMAPGPEVKR